MNNHPPGYNENEDPYQQKDPVVREFDPAWENSHCEKCGVENVELDMYTFTCEPCYNSYPDYL